MTCGFQSVRPILSRTRTLHQRLKRLHALGQRITLRVQRRVGLFHDHSAAVQRSSEVDVRRASITSDMDLPSCFGAENVHAIASLFYDQV